MSQRVMKVVEREVRRSKYLVGYSLKHTTRKDRVEWKISRNEEKEEVSEE